MDALQRLYWRVRMLVTPASVPYEDIGKRSPSLANYILSKKRINKRISHEDKFTIVDAHLDEIRFRRTLSRNLQKGEISLIDLAHDTDAANRLLSDEKLRQSYPAEQLVAVCGEHAAKQFNFLSKYWKTVEKAAAENENAWDVLMQQALNCSTVAKKVLASDKLFSNADNEKKWQRAGWFVKIFAKHSGVTNDGSSFYETIKQKFGSIKNWRLFKRDSSVSARAAVPAAGTQTSLNGDGGPVDFLFADHLQEIEEIGPHFAENGFLLTELSEQGFKVFLERYEANLDTIAKSLRNLAESENDGVDSGSRQKIAESKQKAAILLISDLDLFKKAFADEGDEAAILKAKETFLISHADAFNEKLLATLQSQDLFSQKENVYSQLALESDDAAKAFLLDDNITNILINSQSITSIIKKHAGNEDFDQVLLKHHPYLIRTAGVQVLTKEEKQQKIREEFQQRREKFQQRHLQQRKARSGATSEAGAEAKQKVGIVLSDEQIKQTIRGSYKSKQSIEQYVRNNLKKSGKSLDEVAKNDAIFFTELLQYDLGHLLSGNKITLALAIAENTGDSNFLKNNLIIQMLKGPRNGPEAMVYFSQVAQEDQVLSDEDFYDIVVAHHRFLRNIPLYKARLADLLQRAGDTNNTIAEKIIKLVIENKVGMFTDHETLTIIQKLWSPSAMIQYGEHLKNMIRDRIQVFINHAKNNVELAILLFTESVTLQMVSTQSNSMKEILEKHAGNNVFRQFLTGGEKPTTLHEIVCSNRDNAANVLKMPLLASELSKETLESISEKGVDVSKWLNFQEALKSFEKAKSLLLSTESTNLSKYEKAKLLAAYPKEFLGQTGNNSDILLLAIESMNANAEAAILLSTTQPSYLEQVELPQLKRIEQQHCALLSDESYKPYYQQLQLPQGASAAEIEEAYEVLSKESNVKNDIEFLRIQMAEVQLLPLVQLREAVHRRQFDILKQKAQEFSDNQQQHAEFLHTANLLTLAKSSTEMALEILRDNTLWKLLDSTQLKAIDSHFKVDSNDKRQLNINDTEFAALTLEGFRGQYAIQGEGKGKETSEALTEETLHGLRAKQAYQRIEKYLEFKGLIAERVNVASESKVVVNNDSAKGARARGFSSLFFGAHRKQSSKPSQPRTRAFTFWIGSQQKATTPAASSSSNPTQTHSNSAATTTHTAAVSRSRAATTR